MIDKERTKLEDQMFNAEEAAERMKKDADIFKKKY